MMNYVHLHVIPLLHKRIVTATLPLICELHLALKYPCELGNFRPHHIRVTQHGVNHKRLHALLEHVGPETIDKTSASFNHLVN